MNYKKTSPDFIAGDATTTKINASLVRPDMNNTLAVKDEL
jgi:hypothetical protein